MKHTLDRNSNTLVFYTNEIYKYATISSTINSNRR